jgi:hypothetical protein
MAIFLFICAGFFVYDMVVQFHDYGVFYPWKMRATILLMLYGAYFSRYAVVVSMMDFHIINIALMWWIPIITVVCVLGRICICRRAFALAWWKLIYGSAHKT